MRLIIAAKNIKSGKVKMSFFTIQYRYKVYDIEPEYKSLEYFTCLNME